MDPGSEQSSILTHHNQLQLHVILGLSWTCFVLFGRTLNPSTVTEQVMTEITSEVWHIERFEDVRAHAPSAFALWFGGLSLDTFACDLEAFSCQIARESWTNHAPACLGSRLTDRVVTSGCARRRPAA